MKSPVKFAAVSSLILAIAPLAAAAQDTQSASSFSLDQVTISPKVSTLGLGIDAKYAIYDQIDMVASLNTFSIDHNELGDIEGDVQGKVDLLSYGIGVEARPFASLGLTFGAGVLKNDNSLSMRAVNNDFMTVAGTQFSSAELAGVNADVKFKTFAPYLTVGYNKTIFGGLSVGASLGALFQGAPKLDVVGVGLNNQAAKDAIEAERAKIEDDMKDFKIMPILALNVAYRF